MRPYYLPREFSHVITIAAYIPPSANAEKAGDLLLSVTSRLQGQHPQALVLISGDFNHAPPSSILPNLYPYVTCCTRDNKILDLFYANAKEAYTSSPLPPLGRSDHNLVHLLPVYKPLVHRQPAVSRTVMRWSDETDEALKDCFETTVWEELYDCHGEDINSLTDCITDYIHFCVENTVPTRTVRCFSNDKPWINPDIKALLKEKKMAFRSGNKDELKDVQKELRRKIREGKNGYRKKMEEQMKNNNVRGVWRGLKTISGHKESKFQAVGGQKWVNDLNLFFNRFDQTPVPPPTQPSLLQSPSSACLLHRLTPTSLSATISPQSSPSSHLIFPNLPPPSISSSTQPCSNLSLTTLQVRNQLRRIKAGKAAGPDGISSRLLKSCADQLCRPLEYMFNLSLKLGRVPLLWKTSCVVPVPKTPHPKDLNSYRPVALTSHLMKTLERLVLGHLRPLLSPVMDPVCLSTGHWSG